MKKTFLIFLIIAGMVNTIELRASAEKDTKECSEDKKQLLDKVFNDFAKARTEEDVEKMLKQMVQDIRFSFYWRYGKDSKPIADQKFDQEVRTFLKAYLGDLYLSPTPAPITKAWNTKPEGDIQAYKVISDIKGKVSHSLHGKDYSNPVLHEAVLAKALERFLSTPPGGPAL